MRACGSGQDRADPDEDRIGIRAHSMHLAPRFLASDPSMLTCGVSHRPVGRDRELQRCPGTTIGASSEEGGVQLAGRLTFHTDVDLNSRVAETGGASAGDD